MKHTLLFLLFTGLQWSLFAQDFSNKGTDFWVGYGNHVRGYQVSNNASPQQMSLYITSDVNTNGIIDIPGIGYTQQFSVGANAVTEVVIPQSAYLYDEGKYNLGIHVTAENPVVVYAHIYASNVSGATLVLPTKTLGKAYYSVNYTQQSNESNSYSFFFVIATEDNTIVEITPAAATKGGAKANLPFTVTMKRGEVYQVLSSSDLTGSKIRSISNNSSTGCKRIAVFSGSGKIYIGCESANTRNYSSDNLFQQVYPTTTWGKTYITVPSKDRPRNYFRVVLSDPNTHVSVNGNTIPLSSFVNNFYYEFQSTSPNLILADKPIMVAQYLTTMACGELPNVGDPEMIFLNPVEQTIQHITLYSTPKYRITQHYINVVIKTKAANSFLLDGVPPAGGFTPLSNDSTYSYGSFNVSVGAHNLLASDGFNAIAYGYGSAESYGYSAGTNVKDLNQYIFAQHHQGNSPLVGNACTRDTLLFLVALTTPPTRLSWNFDNGSVPVVTDNPLPDSSKTINGKTVYFFHCPVVTSFSASRIYKVNVVAQNLLADGCDANQQIDLDFAVDLPPSSAFAADSTVCLGASVNFTDQSKGNGRRITGWYWNFGDGTTGSTAHPQHQYLLPGTYVVSLAVTNENGCTSDTARKKVLVFPSPRANFSISDTSCGGQSIAFHDLSVTDSGYISTWKWNYGDGNQENRTDGNPLTHIYTSHGTYIVSLQVMNNLNCSSEMFTKSINVYPTPIVNFILPEVCLNDAFALFKDSSFIADGSMAAFRYAWKFGDPFGTASNPDTSSDKNPKHKYSQAAKYNVSLVVSSDHNCASSLVKPFTVNGAVPKSDFRIASEEHLCSNLPVTITNVSTVDFGQITRVVVYFDWHGNKTDSLVDEDPRPNKSYIHNYPLFNTPSANQQYTILMRAYSGISCVNEIQKTIVLLPSPTVSFTVPPNVCENASPFNITTAKELNGFSGSGIFTGAGVNSSGLFDPLRAGPGKHLLRYTFTASNGCKDYQEQTITVFNAPSVFAGNDTTLLEGGILKLHATASSNVIAYKWSPAIALDATDIPDPTISPKDAITYTLTVSTADGCTASDDIHINVLKEPVVPNAFTPNGDGVNDVWNIQYLNTYPNASLQIFNRYGQLIFRSTGYAQPWDGKINGQVLPVGTYYYIIDPKNGRKVITGSVTILR